MKTLYKRKQRFCLTCNDDLYQRNLNAKYCKKCAKLKATKQRTEFYKRNPHYIKIQNRLKGVTVS